MTLSGAKKGRHTWQEFSRCTRLGGLLTRHVSADAATLEAISFTSTSTNAVYLIASLHHDGWYVGQTKDMTRRTREHFLATVRSQSKEKTEPQQRVHRYMMALGIHEFFIVPLVLFPAATNALARLHVERMFIKLLQPQLNVTTVEKKHDTKMQRGKRARPSPRKRRRLNQHRISDAGERTQQKTPTTDDSRNHGMKAPGPPKKCFTQPGVSQQHLPEDQFWGYENNRRDAMNRATRFRLTSAVYLRSRMDTAARHLILAAQGGALPKNMCEATMRNIWSVTRDVPEWKSIATPSPLPLRSRQCESPVNETLQQGVSTFRIQTPNGIWDTQSLMRALWEIMLQTPTARDSGKFTLTRVQITIQQRGILRARIPSCTMKKLWCPLAFLYPTTAPLTIHRSTMKQALHGLQTGAVIVAYLPAVSFGVKIDPRMVVLFYDVGRNQQNTAWLLRGIPLEAVLLMYKRHTIIQSMPWKETVGSRLLNHLQMTWGISPVRKLLCKIPSTTIKGTFHLVRSFLMQTLADLHIDPVPLHNIMLSNTSIIMQKGETVSDIATNMIKVAKSMKRLVLPECTCDSLRSLFEEKTTGEHLCARANSAIQPWLKHALGNNASTTVCVHESPEAVVGGTVATAFTAVTKWLGNKRVYMRPGVDEMATAVAMGKTALKGWHQGTVEAVVEAAVGLGEVPNAALWENAATLTGALALQQNLESNKTYISKSQVQRGCEAVVGSVITPLDRNAGQLCIMCPTRYHLALFGTFQSAQVKKSVTFGNDTIQRKTTCNRSCIRGQKTPTYKSRPDLTSGDGTGRVAHPVQGIRTFGNTSQRSCPLCVRTTQTQRPGTLPANCIL